MLHQEANPKWNFNMRENRCFITYVFKSGIEILKNVEVDIRINPKVKPCFYRGLPVPYALKDKIEHELGRLVREGIYESVASSI